MFTQECFIRKNTKYLREKLNELGYTCFRDVVSFRFLSTNIYFDKGVLYDEYVYYYDVFNYESTFHSMSELIDCGTNEELFLAIAALRDESDKNQWFIHDDSAWNDKPNIFWYKCESENIEIDIAYDGMWWDWSKATVSELIEHFKK